jgi:hypothetical protein
VDDCIHPSNRIDLLGNASGVGGAFQIPHCDAQRIRS